MAITRCKYTGRYLSDRLPCQCVGHKKDRYQRFNPKKACVKCYHTAHSSECQQAWGSSDPMDYNLCGCTWVTRPSYESPYSTTTRELHYCPICGIVTATYGPQPCRGIVMKWNHPRVNTINIRYLYKKKVSNPPNPEGMRTND